MQGCCIGGIMGLIRLIPDVGLGPGSVLLPPYPWVAERVANTVEFTFTHVDILQPTLEIAWLPMVMFANEVHRLATCQDADADVFRSMICAAAVSELYEF